MALDSQHLPEDPKILQKMVLDLMAQLDRESAERHKFEANSSACFTRNFTTTPATEPYWSVKPMYFGSRDSVLSAL